jgi:hypothetical protein
VARAPHAPAVVDRTVGRAAEVELGLGIGDQAEGLGLASPEGVGVAEPGEVGGVLTDHVVEPGEVGRVAGGVQMARAGPAAVAAVQQPDVPRGLADLLGLGPCLGVEPR